MQALNTQANWNNPSSPQHWIKHGVLPVALIAAFLWLPKPWKLAIFQPNNLIEIELIDSQAAINTPPIAEPETIPQPLAKPTEESVIQKPIESIPKIEEKVSEPAPEKTSQIQTKSIHQESITIKTTPKISAGDVFQMIQDRQSIDISSEFQARIHPATDFYIPEQKVHDWLADIPYLDESVDKPKLKMKFYAEGYQGSIEKFFDKITISKTFTTKYGTKINCALIGVIVACGWK